MPEVIDLTIGGMLFPTPMRYEAGQTLGETEAKILNSLWVKRLRNGFMSRVTDQEALTSQRRKELLAVYAEWIGTVDLPFRPQPERDPIWDEALDLASKVLLAELSQREPPLTPSPEKLKSASAALLLRRPDLIETARQRVASKTKVAEDMLADLL